MHFANEYDLFISVAIYLINRLQPAHPTHCELDGQRIHIRPFLARVIKTRWRLKAQSHGAAEVARTNLSMGDQT